MGKNLSFLAEIAALSLRYSLSVPARPRALSVPTLLSVPARPRVHCLSLARFFWDGCD
jgi:hypothetical protein